MSVMHTLGIAEVKVVRSPDTLWTVLGSCVGVVLYDLGVETGGMVHVMLPNSNGDQGRPGKYADTAIDRLLELVLAAGCSRAGLHAKIAGGGAIFGPLVDCGIGRRNVEAVRTRLADLGIRIVAGDVGGDRGRKVLFAPATGSVEVRVLGKSTKVI